MRTRFLVVVLVLGSQLLGCALANSIYRRTTIRQRGQSADVLFVDAKQRMVTAGLDTKGILEICAEPSPDALSAYAAAVAGEGGNGQIQAALRGAFSESAASFGLRTQSITLLRDYMYRICEAYRNGRYDDHQVTVLHRRFQVVMVGLLAIEQLTGAVAAGQVAVSASGSAGVDAPILAKMAEKNEQAVTAQAKAKADYEAAQKTTTAADAALKTAKEEEAKLKDEVAKDPTKQKDLDAKTKQVGELATAKGKAEQDELSKKTALETADATAKAAKENLDLVKTASATTQGQSTVVPATVRGMPTDPGAVKAVAKAVTKIVESTTQLNRYVSDECLVTLRDPEPSSERFRDFCWDLMHQIGSYYEIRKDRFQVVNQLLRQMIADRKYDDARHLLEGVAAAEDDEGGVGANIFIRELRKPFLPGLNADDFNREE